MASGFEVVGLVLAVLPIVISALENYEKGISTIQRFRAYRREVRSICIALQTEQVLFGNSCEQLLKDIVSPVELELLLKEPGGTQWTLPHISRNLQTRLGSSYSIYIIRVQDIVAAIEEFKQRLDLDNEGKV
jgi:hypothetical protein